MDNNIKSTSTIRRKVKRYFFLITPPLIINLVKKITDIREQWQLPASYRKLERGAHGLHKLIKDYDFDTVLDVGSGGGEHAQMLHDNGKKVTTLDFGKSVYFHNKQTSKKPIENITGDFLELALRNQYDCLWASHVLEHQPDPGRFIRKCMETVKENGIIAITVPPLKNEVVGGHLTLWNAGTLLYQLVFNGIDARDASISTYGYNITIIVRNRRRGSIELTWDKGDIYLLKEYLPEFINEPFEGQIKKWNW